MRSQNGGGVEKLGPLTPEITDSRTLYDNLRPFLVQGHGSSLINSFIVVPKDVFIYFVGYSGTEVGYADSAPWLWKDNHNTYFEYLYKILYEPGFSDSSFIRPGAVILQPGDVLPDISLSFSPTEIYYPPLGMFPVPIRDDEKEEFGLLNQREFFYLPTLLKIVKEGYITKKKIMSLGIKEELKEELSRILDLTIDVRTLPLNKLDAKYWFIHSSPPPFYKSMETYRIMKTKKNMLKGNLKVNLSNLISSTKLHIKSKYYFFIVTACRGSISKKIHEAKHWLPAYLPPTVTPKQKLQRRFSLATRPAEFDVGCALPNEPPLNFANILNFYSTFLKDSNLQSISNYLDEAIDEEKATEKFILYSNYEKVVDILENIVTNNLTIKLNEFLSLLNFSTFNFDQSSLSMEERLPFAEELFSSLKRTFARFVTGVQINLGAGSRKPTSQLIMEALDEPVGHAPEEAVREVVEREQTFLAPRRGVYDYEMSEHKKLVIRQFIDEFLSARAVQRLYRAIIDVTNELRAELASDVAELESRNANFERGISQLQKTYNSANDKKQKLVNLFSDYFAKFKMSRGVFLSESDVETIQATVFPALFTGLLEVEESTREALERYTATNRANTEGGYRKIGTRRHRKSKAETRRKCRTGCTARQRSRGRTRA